MCWPRRSGCSSPAAGSRSRDMVFQGDAGLIPQSVRDDVEQWAGCVAGALEEHDYLARLRRAGFESPSIEVTTTYDDKLATCGSGAFPRASASSAPSSAPPSRRCDDSRRGRLRAQTSGWQRYDGGERGGHRVPHYLHRPPRACGDRRARACRMDRSPEGSAGALRTPRHLAPLSAGRRRAAGALTAGACEARGAVARRGVPPLALMGAYPPSASSGRPGGPSNEVIRAVAESACMRRSWSYSTRTKSTARLSRSGPRGSMRP